MYLNKGRFCVIYEKKFLIILIICVLATELNSAEKKISDFNNEYGGITETFIISPSEKDYEQFSEVSFFYDKNKQKIKVVYNLSSFVEEQTGYSQQAEIYSNGRMIEYRMIFSNAGVKKYGVKEIIEKINEENITSEIWYSNGYGIAKNSANSFTLNYPLYSLPYLEEVFELEENKNASFNISAKYYTARSFVHFNGEYENLNENDKKAIEYFGDFLSNESMIDLYTTKSTVLYDGKEYTVYIQKNLLPYLKKNMEFLMAYGVMGLNGKLVLFITEFTEINYENMR